MALSLYKQVGEIPYGYCSGTTLKKFDLSFTFPFYNQYDIPNSPSCSSSTPHVCDLATTAPPQVTKPTTITSGDGAVSWTVTSAAGGTIRYSLTDVPFGQMTNTSGTFSSLGLGYYTIYARDLYNCLLKSTFVIDAPLVAGINNAVLYRQEYKDLNGKSSRIDILKRDYAGAITDVKGASEPFVIKLRGENGDFFDSIIASEATQNLISETNLQFLGLYTDDDRKYQVIFYKDLGSGLVEQWRGFINPVLYSEKYDRDTNYYVAVQSTDQLVSLKNYYFLDSAGNGIYGNVSLVTIIATILLKTDSLLPIRIAVNIFDSNMSTGGANDPLNQAYIDATTYAGMTCWDVLSDVIGSFGACLFQWGGYWHIRRRAETTGSYAYRQYNFAGVYQSNGTTTSITSAWKWQGRSQNLLMVGSKGIVAVTHKLEKNESYVRNGGFEEATVNPGEIPGYTLFLNGNAGNVSKVSGNGSQVAIKITSNSANTSVGNDAYVISESKPVTLDAIDKIHFTLDFFPDGIPGKQITKFTKFKVLISLGGAYFLKSDGTWAAVETWIEITTQNTDANKWNTLDFSAFSPYAATTTTTVQVRIMHGSTFGDAWCYTSEANLKALPTITPIFPNYIAWIKYPFSYVINSVTYQGADLYYYKLRRGTDAEVSPTILRPADFNAVNNPLVWENIGTDTGLLNYVGTYGTLREITGYVRIFDNLKIEILPGGSDIPTNKIYYFDSASKNRNNITKEFLTGDSPVEITNGAYSYINVLKLSNGNLTRLWKRTSNSNEQLPLLSLLSKQIGEQLFVPKFKLMGTVKQSSFFGFDAVPTEYGKNYALAGMTLMDKMGFAQVEMYQITTETSTGIINEFISQEFSTTEIGITRSS